MLKRLLTVIALCVGMQSADAAALEFSDADWARIPNPVEITVAEVMELFAGSIVKNGHEWILASFDNDDLTTVIADKRFEVRQFDDERLFAHQPFYVDSAGILRYELVLVSLTQTYPREEGDGDEELSMVARMPISTQLMAEELTRVFT